MKSNSPSDIIKASKVLSSIDERQPDNDKKSYIIDPMEFNSSFGYKDKPYSLSYNTLKMMSKTPIVNAIIKTRKNQLADFLEPQADKYSTGFVIRKKKTLGQSDKENTKADWKRIEEIQNIILNCGVNNSWEGDDFESFGRKLIDDSLTYDQATFEVVRDKKGQIFEFFATDASSYRIAASYDDENYKGIMRPMVKGYYPAYVQIYQGAITNDFYPWDLCFGIRNPTTAIYNAGYGISELEELVSTVTSMLWADDYNKKFFSQGSAPKGLLRVKGQVNEKQLKAFRQEWLSMVTGVQQAWKTPIVDADIDWIDLQKSNRDMEFSSWSEYLIKITCAIFSIDPNEIGFNLSSSSGSAMFESNNEAKLTHSKDKGLYPLLKFFQRKFNKFIVSQIDPDFEFLFVGLNGLTIQEELDMEIQKLSNFQTVNEIRNKYGLKPIKGGDIILNPTFVQQATMEAQKESGMVAQNANGKKPEDKEDDSKDLLDTDNKDDEDNPFKKAFMSNLSKK